jgi:Kef-type K+ transport system membrane component KefB
MNRNLLFYVLTIAIFGSLLYFIFNQGTKLEVERFTRTGAGEIHEETSVPDRKLEAASQDGILITFLRSLSQNVRHPLSLLLVQIATIVLFSRGVVFFFTKLGQPTVIGEIIAGIILGPSVVGLFWPEISNFLFQPDSLANLEFFSNFGLILFMFIIGLELDIRLLKHKAHTAVVVSHIGIIFPFFLGATLAYYLFETLAPPHISFLAFGLFMGIAMSITAFPVLARIIRERGLSQSPLGSLAITCAAADDVTAWCILAAVIAIVQAGSVISAVFTVLLSSFYVLVMLKLVRPLLRQLGARYATPENFNKTFMAFTFAILFLSAFTTEVIGIHALFGAFLAGVSMPSQASFRKSLAARIEDVSLVILLPLFFAFTGLKTQIGLLNDGSAWLICGLIILVAVAGKFGGSLLAAKFTGQSWSDSFAIGALMNTRGLMELIVLNIGYDLGVLSPAVFTMMVLMALVTTFMTCPALSLIERIRWKRETISVKSLPERL